MFNEHPGFSLMTATRLGREAHGSRICTFSRTESGREGKENKHIIQFLAKQFKLPCGLVFKFLNHRERTNVNICEIGLLLITQE